MKESNTGRPSKPYFPSKTRQKKCDLGLHEYTKHTTSGIQKRLIEVKWICRHCQAVMLEK